MTAEVTEETRIDIGWYRHEGYTVAKLNCGKRKVEHVVPPAGEEYAFDRDVWPRTFEVCVSPTGRSVRLWVDGVEQVLP